MQRLAAVPRALLQPGRPRRRCRAPGRAPPVPGSGGSPRSRPSAGTGWRASSSDEPTTGDRRCASAEHQGCRSPSAEAERRGAAPPRRRPAGPARRDEGQQDSDSATMTALSRSAGTTLAFQMPPRESTLATTPECRLAARGEAANWPRRRDEGTGVSSDGRIHGQVERTARRERCRPTARLHRPTQDHGRDGASATSPEAGEKTALAPATRPARTTAASRSRPRHGPARRRAPSRAGAA